MPTHRELDPDILTVFFPEDGQMHGGINKHGSLSRWFIGDLDYDDLQNFAPLGPELQQTPAAGAVIATLAAPAVWISAQPLNLAVYLFCLCTNGHVYQVSLGGVITDVTGATSLSTNSDIANWQGTTIILTDVNASKVYSWNGTTFATVFSSQPEAFIAVYNSRLWMVNQSTIAFTAGGTFNSLGGDAGSFIVTDTDCPPPIRAITPYGGNLFVAGYNWIKIYGGLFDSGIPPVLQFQQSTLTDEAGVINKWGILPFGYSFYYSALQGIWNLIGSQPVFASQPMDGFFQNLNVANSSFSSAFGWVLGIPCLMWNFQYAADSTYRVACMIYDINPQNQKWFTLNSPVNISFITYGVDQTSGKQKVWGVDTSGKLYELLASPSTTVTSKASSKLWSFGRRIRLKSIKRAGVELITTGPVVVGLTANDQNLNTYTPDLQSLNPTTTFKWSNGIQSTFNWNNAGAFTWTAPGTQYEMMEFDLPITGKKLGLNLTVTGSGVAVGAFGVEYEELPADWGSIGATT